MKLATSNTLEGITKLINQYYYTTSCRVEEGKVYNSKGLIAGVEVVEKKGRYIFKSTAQ